MLCGQLELQVWWDLTVVDAAGAEAYTTAKDITEGLVGVQQQCHCTPDQAAPPAIHAVHASAAAAKGETATV